MWIRGCEGLVRCFRLGMDGAFGRVLRILETPFSSEMDGDEGWYRAVNMLDQRGEGCDVVTV